MNNNNNNVTKGKQTPYHSGHNEQQQLLTCIECWEYFRTTRVRCLLSSLCDCITLEYHKVLLRLHSGSNLKREKQILQFLPESKCCSQLNPVGIF